MIRIFRFVAAVIALTLCLSLGSFARDNAKPLPKAGYVDAMAGQPVKPDGSGPDVYVRTYTSVGYDTYIATGTEAMGGKVQSYKFSTDTKGTHLQVLVKGTLFGGTAVRFARVDVTKGTTGYTLGAVSGPTQSVQTSQAKEAPVVAGGVTFK